MLRRLRCVYKTCYIHLLNSSVPLSVIYKSSKMRSNLLLLFHLIFKVWSSVASEGLPTDKCPSGAASSASGLKNQQGSKICFHDPLPISHEYRCADGLILNLSWHNQGTSTYHTMQLSSLSQKPELVIWYTNSLTSALLYCLVLIESWQGIIAINITDKSALRDEHEYVKLRCQCLKTTPNFKSKQAENSRSQEETSTFQKVIHPDLKHLGWIALWRSLFTNSWRNWNDQLTPLASAKLHKPVWVPIMRRISFIKPLFFQTTLACSRTVGKKLEN